MGLFYLFIAQLPSDFFSINAHLAAGSLRWFPARRVAQAGIPAGSTKLKTHKFYAYGSFFWPPRCARGYS